MKLEWTSKAVADLGRLYDFLAPVNRQAAARTVQSLTSAPARLLEQPRIGERLEEFDPREVRRILVGHYEIRYEIRQSTIYVLRLWHTREGAKRKGVLVAKGNCPVTIGEDAILRRAEELDALDAILPFDRRDQLAALPTTTARP